MSSIFKEYSFVVISMLSAIVFFILLSHILAYKNRTSITRMMGLTMQYDKTNTVNNYGRDKGDENLTSVQNDMPYIKIASDKKYIISDEPTIFAKTQEEPNLDDTKVMVTPQFCVFTKEFMMRGVGLEHTSKLNANDDIELTVIDYTPSLVTPDAENSSKVNTVNGKMADPEPVIAVDKYGNRKVDTGTSYRQTTRVTFQQRNNVDSSKLAADDYDLYYGQVYFYKNGKWYEDTNNNGTYDEGDMPHMIYSNNLDLAAGRVEAGDKGVEFNTDIPHKFKVIYRIVGNEDSDYALKSEVTKLFVAKSREQYTRSISVWQSVYDKKDSEEPVTDAIPPESAEGSTSDVDDYNGKRGVDVVNDAVANKLNNVRAWQEEEKRKEEERKEEDEDEDDDDKKDEGKPAEPKPADPQPETPPQEEPQPETPSEPSGESGESGETPSGE